MLDKTIVIRGTLDWAKIVGDARPYTGNPKYNKGPYWSVDVTPDKASRKKIKEAGIDEKLREPKGEKETRKDTFLTLKVNESQPDGKKNRPVDIIDAQGNKWDGSDIGNGSVADIMIKVKFYEDTVGAYIQKVRILEHVAYEGSSFEPLADDDKFFKAANPPKVSFAFEADYDDDVPF